MFNKLIGFASNPIAVGALGLCGFAAGVASLAISYGTTKFVANSNESQSNINKDILELIDLMYDKIESKDFVDIDEEEDDYDE